MIEPNCSGCTTGTLVHNNNITTSREYLSIGRKLLQQPGIDAAIQSATYPTTVSQENIERVVTNNEQLPLLSKFQLHSLTNQPVGSVAHHPQYPADDFRACVTAIYLCVVIANSTRLNCNLIESLCNQYAYNQHNIDATSYLNPSSIEAALEELVAFAGGGEGSKAQDDNHDSNRAKSNNKVKTSAKSTSKFGHRLRDGSKSQLDNHLDHNKTNKHTGDALVRLKLGSKLARRLHQARASVTEEQGKEQSTFTSWIPRLLRNLNWDSFWVSSSDADEEEMLADQPAQSFDTTEPPPPPPLSAEKFQILRPIDRNVPKNENQTGLKLDPSSSLALFANEPNSMHQDEDISSSSSSSSLSSSSQKVYASDNKSGVQLSSQEMSDKILNANKDFELSGSNILDPFLPTRSQPSMITDKPQQQQVLIPIRNECRCPSKPVDEIPLECRYSNKCFPIETSDLKNDATLGQSSIVKPPLEVSFLHYTRYQRRAEYLDVSNDSSLELAPISFEQFNVSLPVKVVIHGFGSGGHKSWVQEMVYKILEYEDVNVIVVDWEKGAAMPHYVQAAGNTKLVGQRLAHLIHSLNARFGLTGNSYHLIGFSLGAHVAGFAGAEIRNTTTRSGSSPNLINRITGLDPASLLFEGYEPSERLDPSDAQFVDVIHSNGDGVLRGGFGAIQELGHVDFYPNGGRVQVGCNSVLLSALSDIIYGKWQSLCNHRRAVNFFMDSFEYSKCRFKSFNCDTYENYLKGECFDCGSNNEKCSYMGYFADLSAGRGRMYLTTHEDAPFCANQFLIKITGTRGYKSHWGKVEVTFKTFDGKNESFWLSSSTVKEANGDQSSSGFSQHNMQSLIVAHSPLSNFTQVLLRYSRYKGWIYNGNESWSIDKILITDSNGQMKSYCGYSTMLQSQMISRVDLEPGNCSVMLELPPEPTSSTYTSSKSSPHQKTGSSMHLSSDKDIQSRQTETKIVLPLITKPQQEPALTSTSHQNQLASKLNIGYFPDRWQQQHRIRHQQVASFVNQLTNNNLLQIKAI